MFVVVVLVSLCCRDQMLSESEQMRREADDTGPYAEFEHWRQLNARFNSVLEQIRSHECRMAIQILHISKSKILKVTAVILLTTSRLYILCKPTYPKLLFSF